MKENNLVKLISWIKRNYKDLPKSIVEGKELVIFSTGDFSGEYGWGSSDLKSWGVDSSGKLFWAYASGCSCGCSAGTEEKTVKIFESEIPSDLSGTDIENAVNKFIADREEFKKSISSYEYKSY